MWKKIGVAIIALLSTFSVVYTLSKGYLLATQTYGVGGSITGRVNQVGSGTNATLGNNFVKGDKILMGLKNPHTGNPLEWQLQKQVTYTDYGCTLATTCPAQPEITSWYAQSMQSIGKTVAYPDNKNWVGTTKNFSLSNTYKNYMQPLNNALSNAAVDYSIVAPRSLNDEHKGNAAGPSYVSDVIKTSAFSTPDMMGRSIFLLDIYTSMGQIGAKATMAITAEGGKFSSSYQTASCYNSPSTAQGNIIWTMNGEPTPPVNNATSTAYDIRPGVMLDLSKVVFSLSVDGNSGTTGSVKEPSLPSSLTSLYSQAIGSPMKVRIHNNTMTADISDLKKLDSSALSQTGGTYQIDNGKKIKISAKGNNVVANSTLSAIVIDENNKFVLYQKLGAATGNTDEFTLDTSSLAVGKYKIAVVNEQYDDTNTAPASSSLLTKELELEIVEPHTINYTASPQSQSTYEYDKNVEEGDIIGSLSRSEGAVPIHYEIVADGSDTSFQNFEIDGLDVHGNSSATLLDIKIKSNGAPDIVSATNSLKAGTYKFCIESTDANGAPDTQVLGKSKVCASLTVDKTTPTITFDTTSQKDMKIGDSDYTDTVTTTNTDTLKPGDISYVFSGGIAQVLTSASDTTNPLGYNVSVVSTHTGSGLPATFTLEATIAETDNYLAATTTVNKPIYVYKELSALDWVASKSSYSASDVVSGSIVGTLLGKDGVGPFKYEMTVPTDPGYVASDATDNASFAVVSGSSVPAGTKVNVKTTTSLAIGTYNIQYKVTDDKGKIAYVKAEITVSAKNQSVVDFKDKTGGNIITGSGIKVKYNDTSKSLFAEGGSTLVPIEYYLADQADQPGGIDPTLYLSVNQANGALTPIKIGTVKVYAQRPGDATYSSANSGFMEVTIEKALQSVAFNSTTNPTKVGIGKSVTEDASGKVTLDNTAGIGGIIYESSDTNIATVDASGKVTGVKAGSVTITATLNDPSSSSYDPNYETVDCQKTVTVYKGMSLTWTKENPHLKAEDAAAGDTAGVISVSDNTGAVTYKISTNTGTPENIDGALFQVVNKGLSVDVQLKNAITAADLYAHGNTYKIQVEATDQNGTTTIDLVITIDDAPNDAYFTEDGSKITTLTKVYGEDNNSFSLTSLSSNGGSVTYQVEASDTSGTLNVTGTGTVTINKVGTATVEAVIAGGFGYDGATITLPITITAGKQSIDFIDTTTVNRQFVANSTFQDPAELIETSAEVTSTRTITYTSDTPSVCSIDDIGTITMLTKGSCIVKANNADANWKSASATKTINLYDGMGVSFTQSDTPQAEKTSGQAGSSVGSLVVSGGSGTKTYAISSANDPKNIDASFFAINSSGVISLKKDINASDIKNYYDNGKGAYIMHVQFDTTDDLGNTVTTDAEIEIKGAQLNASFDTGGVGKISKVYSPNGTFNVNLSSNAGNGTPTYQIKNDPAQPSDVLKSVSASGSITIDNANDRSSNANPVMIEAVIPASNGYDTETIEVEVEITKANQPDFGFKNTTINMSTDSSMTPALTGKLSTGKVTLTSKNVALVSVNGNDIETNKTEGTTTITIIDAGDRNYKSATGTATVNVSSEPAYGFIISVPSATYGDSGVTSTIELNELEDVHPGATPTQEWKSSDPTIADVDADGNITIYKAGSVDITCTQSSTGDPTVSSTATLVIKPKPITIVIDDTSKYVGEAMPSFTATIPTTDLVGSDTIEQPNFTCLDGAGANVMDTTAAGSYPITGNYATGSNPNYDITFTPGTLTIKQDTSFPTWYHLEGVTSGNVLDPTKWYNEDVKVVLDPAVESAGTYDEISLDKTLWDPTSITVTGEDEHSEEVTFRISASDPTHPLAMSSSQATTIKIDKTKAVIKSITGTQTNKDAISSLLNQVTLGKYFKPGTKVSITSEDILPSANVKVSGVKEVSYEVYEIDKSTGLINTTPKTSGILTPDASGISEVTLPDAGLYRVCAIATDHAGNQGIVSCSDLNVKNIDIDIDGDGDLDMNDTDEDGCPDLNIVLGKDTDGNWIKLNVDRDGDGIPDMNIDSKGTGKADLNVDTDKDKKPDLNLVVLTKDSSQGTPTVWKPTVCVKDQAVVYCTGTNAKPLINVDTDDDRIPDININTTGEMKADINVDKNNNGKLDANDLNIAGKLKTWTPNKDYIYSEFAYDTQVELKAKVNVSTGGADIPDINIDTDGDGLPDINIDADGNGIPEINIDGDGDGEPDYNLDPDGTGQPTGDIIILDKWEPNLPGKKDNVSFNTTEIKKKSILEDGGIQVENPGGTFLPNFSIKVKDVTDSVDDKVKDAIGKVVGDKDIDNIFDVSLWNGNTQVQPDGTLRVKVPYDGTLKNPKVIVELADGTFKEVDAKIEDGYLVYDSNYLGRIAIVEDTSTIDPIPDNKEPIPDVTDKTPQPDTSVKGAYSSIGGALTGDETSILIPLLLCVSFVGGIFTLIFVNRNNKKNNR